MAEVADWSVERVEREVGKAEAQAERTEAVGLEALQEVNLAESLATDKGRTTTRKSRE